MAAKYDVVIIGGGPGGLTCGALLAKWGCKVLLIEKNERTGGKAVTSANGDGFAYELGPKLQVPAQGPSFAVAFEELGIKSRLKPIALKTTGLVYRGRSGKYRRSVLQGNAGGIDPGPLMDLWELDGPEREAVLKFMADMIFLPADEVSALDDVSTQEWLARFPNVPRPLYSYMMMHANASLAEPIELVSASEQVQIMQDIGLKGGAGYYEGGFGRVLDDLARAMEAAGGEVRTRARVQKIKVSGGRVTGVVTDTDSFEAPIVVSDAGIQPTVLKLVGEKEFDQGYLGWVKGLVPGWCFTGVKYFLSRKVLTEQVYDIWADDTTLNLPRFREQRAGRVADEVLVFATVPSNWDPSMAPPGRQCVIAGTICSPDPTAEEIKLLHDRLDRMWEKLFPGVMESLIYKEIEGPSEVSQLTRDSVLKGQGGECVGLGQVVGQCGRYQPSPAAPIGGLFYTGADVGIAGMGTHKASGGGIRTARMVLRYRNLRQAMR